VDRRSITIPAELTAMSRVLSEKKPYLLLFLLLGINLVLMSSRVRGPRQDSVLEEAILSISSPVLKAADWVSGGLAAAWKGYVALIGVERENRALRAERDRLAGRAAAAEEARREVERLSSLLDLKERSERPGTAARVISQGGGGLPTLLLLDRGAPDGVGIHQSVITPRGVVGQIVESAPGISKVQTILDPNSGVAALIQRTRVQGVLVGEGTGICRLEFVSRLSNVEVGDVVVTSGLDRIHPKGIILGVVSALGEGEGLTRMVEVLPEIDFMRLEEVLVLRPEEDAAGGPP
jgi:rod shape-determining protein MreC